MPKHCPNCGQVNDQNSSFCYSCGTTLGQGQTNSMGAFSYLSLAPTSVCRPSGTQAYWFVVIPLCIVFLISIFVAGVAIFEKHLEYGKDFAIFAIALGVAAISFIFIRKFYLKTRTFDITADADYVEQFPRNKKFPIICKDGKLGVYNLAKRVVQIPCEYQEINWKSNLGVLHVNLNGDEFDIDINNNRLR